MSVQDAAVPPVIISHIVLQFGMTVVVGVFLKNSVVAFQTEKQKKKMHPEMVVCGFQSNVHLLAFLTLVVYYVNATDMWFTTNLFFPSFIPSCRVVSTLSTTLFALSKFTQYGFFIARLKNVFRESFLKLSPVRTNILLVTLVVYVIGLAAGTGFFAFDTAQNVSSAQGKYVVCSRRTEIHPVLIASIFWFIILDTGIMVSVVYGFVWRILEMANIASHDARMVKMYRLAFRALVLFMFSVISSIIVSIIVQFYPDNLMWTFVPGYDMILNSLAIVLNFSFADHAYYSVCRCFDGCIAQVLACLCKGKIQLELLEVLDGTERPNFVASVTATTSSPHSSDINTSERTI